MGSPNKNKEYGQYSINNNNINLYCTYIQEKSSNVLILKKKHI